MSARYRFLTELINDASELALLRFQSHTHLRLDSKLGNDWVSEADFELQKFIIDRILHSFPDDLVVGEEDATDQLFEKQDTPCWIIDPIDGTSNFVNGNPLWGISIGIVSYGNPILGAISLPAMSLGLIGGENYGVRDLQGRQFDRSASRAPVMATSSNVNLNIQDMLVLSTHLSEQGFQSVNYRCGTVGQLFAIMGKVSGFIETSTNYWDIAAGWAIAKAVGLDVTGRIEGTPGEQSIEIISKDAPIRSFLNGQL